MQSAWLASVTRERGYQPLSEDISTDVVVIGAGIAGITTTYMLARAGKSVILIDRNSVLESATAYTTAFLTYVVDTSITDLAEMYGRERARLVWQSSASAIDEIEAISAQEDLECEFLRCPGYLYALENSELSDLKQRAALGQELGFDVSFHSSLSLGIQTPGCLVFSNQAKFHPLKYALGVQARAAACGARIFEHTEATAIEEQGKQLYTVRTKAGSIETKEVVVATHYPFNDPGELFGRTGTYITYIVEAQIPKGSVSAGIYQDTYNPYHYFRIDEGQTEDRMIFGGADHRREIPIGAERNFAALEGYLKDRFSHLSYRITRRWSGPIIEPIDGLPYIGRLSPQNRIFVATGFSGNGMTYGTIAGMIISDLILGNDNAWAGTYDPARRASVYQLYRKGKDYVSELFGGALKNMFAGR